MRTTVYFGSHELCVPSDERELGALPFASIQNDCNNRLRAPAARCLSLQLLASKADPHFWSTPGHDVIEPQAVLAVQHGGRSVQNQKLRDQKMGVCRREFLCHTLQGPVLNHEEKIDRDD